MRGGWRVWTLLAGLMLFVGACTPNCSKTASVTPVSSPSAVASPLASPSSSPVESPSPTPEAPPSASPAPAKLIIVNFSLHIGEVGIGYAPVTIGASGGTPPYRWSIGSGALPTGLGMSPGGTVSGTPGTAGGFSFVVRVDDAGGQAAGVPRSINVAPYLTASGRCTQSCAVEQGCVTVCGTYTDVAGGVPPYTYGLTGGTLPQGTSLNGASLAGTFTTVSLGTSAPAPFTVTITDALGATSSVNAVYSVFPHISFTGGTIGGANQRLCFNSGAGVNNPGCTAQFPYLNGFGTPTVTIGATWTSLSPQATPPPALPTATASGGLVTVNVLFPGATWTSGYTGTMTVVLTDQSPCGPGVNCSSAPATITVTVQTT